MAYAATTMSLFDCVCSRVQPDGVVIVCPEVSSITTAIR